MHQSPHLSVLLNEVIAAFSNVKLTTFVDGTLGAAGHSEAILKEHPEISFFFGIDQDPDALELAQKRLAPWKKKCVLMHENFSLIDQLLQDHEMDKIDGMLLDLGVSSMQLDRPEKGFSFSKDGPLDMRMDPNSELTAKDIVNSWEEKELSRIFWKYGEEKQARRAARAIACAREKKAIETTRELAKVLEPVVRLPRGKKGIHPLTLIFQALRIVVNRELEVIEKAIPKVINLLNPGGRFAVISFHSLEDRIVKNAFRYAASDKEDTTGIGGTFLSKEPLVRIVTKKPIIASLEEVASNPRSRSAKLRVVEKL